VKALIVGTGGIGARHARNLKELRPGIELIGVRSEHSETTRELGMRLVPDLAAGIAERPTAAVVALPPVWHAEKARALLAAGIAVYLEKPPAIRVAELADAANAADMRCTTTMVGCVLRRMPGFRRMRDAIRSGRIGRVISAELSVGQWLPDWRPDRDWRTSYSARRELGGGVILDLMHEIDLARFLVGELAVVEASAGNTGALGIDVEDHADIRLRRDGVTVDVHLDCLDRPGHRRGRVIGTEGEIAYDARAGRLVEHGVASAVDFSAAAAHRDAMANFQDSVEHRVLADQPLSDALKSLALAEQAKASAGLPA
jgi:predicted dehydrogenase